MSGSKKDIAKQFELPERQSKIASIMKQPELYCICRSTDSTSFMIACDNCEEWFHGHCVNINEVQSRQVKHYYCAQCRRENPGMKIEYKKPKGSSSSAHKEKEKAEREKEKEIVVKQEVEKTPTKVGSKRGRPWKKESEKKSVSNYEKDTEYQPQKENKRLTPRNEVVFEEPGPPASRSTSRRSRAPKDEGGMGELKGLRQCHQPKCQQAARPNSKYCSDECGIILASSRLQIILPSRIQEWGSKSVAEEHNDRDLTEIKRKYDATYQLIKDLQVKRDKLDEHIAKVERLKYDPEYETEDEDEEGTVSCVSCGRDVPGKDAIKHMEKCYHKFESQMSFGSKYATTVEGTPIFCDFFNPQTKNYCKRLRVLCNEHTKEPKISDTAICGCPADNEVKPGGRFCRNLKKTCSKHFSWEKLRRGEIDQERVRQFMKIDDLLEQERVVLQAKQDRGGVVALLLNSTFDHDMGSKVEDEEAERQRQRQAYEEEMRQREEKARQIRYEQEKLARARYEQEMMKREEMKMRQQMADAKKSMEAKPTASSGSGNKSVSKQLIAAIADKKNVNYESSGSRSNSSGSSSSSDSSSASSGDEDEMMDVDPSSPDQDSFVHLPSKREKAHKSGGGGSGSVDSRRAFNKSSGDSGDQRGEMTASRLNRKK